jgi:hypothetical protein
MIAVHRFTTVIRSERVAGYSFWVPSDAGPA